MTPTTDFHPLVQKWFSSKFQEPTPAQSRGWEAIRSGEDTLIASPTGSGKTLAAFLVSLDHLISELPTRGEGKAPTLQVVYVSPLKALSHDIQKNLQEPLRELRQMAADEGMPFPEIEVGLRTGDTPARERARMLRRAPDILITTPESLYLMLSAERSRELFRSVKTLILDEIHALVPDRRGTHLSLTLARLDHVAETRPTRIGLSATQKPLDQSAAFLTGTNRPCHVVDIGHQRQLDLGIWVPRHDLQAVASGEHWNEVHSELTRLIREHTTTLIFVNTRRLAERVAHALSQELGDTAVAAHHGSLSRKIRLSLEQKLRDGQLHALVATASLELGIDVGSIDLVCQIESPRHIHTFLQRVGRSGHSLSKTPKGRLFPMTRDDLVESSALVRALGQGALDRLTLPENSLDVLLQQVVAECACETWHENDLYECFRRAHSYRNLERAQFDRLIELASEGIPTGNGTVLKSLHRDRIHGTLRGRRSARMLAIQNGGAIPEVADYRVITDHDETVVGSVDEDFAIESLRGDVFTLGSHSWRIVQVRNGTVRVTDAHGASPTIPFWLGEAPGRSDELSQAVSELRHDVAKSLEDDSDLQDWLVDACALDPHGAQQVARYVRAQRDALGVVPSQEDVVFERFFDDSGGMQLVVHAPFGSRVNRAWGLSLRKRFCQNFDFELQAAASDDSLVLSLGPAQSFPLEDVIQFVRPEKVMDILKQAVLVSPMFAARWRWVATRALAVQRQRQGKKIPPHLQRLRSDDLLAAVFPQTVACQEHISGPIEIPEHPLVDQALNDCLREAMDVDGLIGTVQQILDGRLRVHTRDTTEPSPFCHEILNGRPYTFLDDAPLEERRSRAIQLRQSLPDDVRDLAKLDPAAIDRVQGEIAPAPRDAHELHEVLLSLGHWSPAGDERRRDWLNELIAGGRAVRVDLDDTTETYAAAENQGLARTLFPDASLTPQIELPKDIEESKTLEEAVDHVIRGYLEISGPITADELAAQSHIKLADVNIALAGLENEGLILRGRFRPGVNHDEFCQRRLLARIHRYTLDILRREIEPVSPRDFYRFLLEWQAVASKTKREGKEGVRQTLLQLQGIEVPAKSWEEDILPARIEGYRAGWLDELCISGEISWARLSLGRLAMNPSGRSFQASDVIPITLASREDLGWLALGVRAGDEPVSPEGGAAKRVMELLASKGALFLDAIKAHVQGLPSEVQGGLWELVSRGQVHADGFQPWRGFTPAARRARERASRLRRSSGTLAGLSGRWSLLDLFGAQELSEEEVAEAWAEQLLARWGVVVRELMARESVRVPWRLILRALRRMEAQGRVRGGRFVTGFSGEQYAWPEAVQALRRVRKQKGDDQRIQLSGIDPLNLAGILTSGPKVPALRTRSLTLVGGWPTEDLGTAAG